MAEHFFNLHNESGGIHRSLADGVTTRDLPGRTSHAIRGANRSGV